MRRRSLGTFVVVAALAGSALDCGGKQPASGESISAEEDGAAQTAPVVIRAAQEKLEEASRLRDEKRHERAHELALEVAVEAQLADAINRHAQARARVAELEGTAR